MYARKRCGDAVVLLHFGGFMRKGPVITITDTYTGNNVTLDVATDIPQLHKWFSHNRKPQRKYTFNPKHGDISKKCRAGFAQLETSATDTTNLLKLAVGIDHRSPLWYHDAARGKYIYFENQQETPPNFHGYHVKQGDKNYENIDIDKLRKVQNIP